MNHCEIACAVNLRYPNEGYVVIDRETDKALVSLINRHKYRVMRASAYLAEFNLKVKSL